MTNPASSRQADHHPENTPGSGYNWGDRLTKPLPTELHVSHAKAGLFYFHK
jgi:hypothetical protein